MNDITATTLEYQKRGAGERVPPHSDEAEISVLGGMLLEEVATDRAMELLTEDDFYHPAHRVIFAAISSLRDQGHTPDALSVREELRRHGRLDEIGGEGYLAQIVEIVPTAANLPYHARIVLDAAVKRRLISTGTEIVGEAYQAAEEADQLLNRAEEKIFRISERRFKRSFVPINQLLQGAVLQLESLAGRGEAITGAPSGFTDLDEMTAGFQLADLLIVAGRPSLGKCLARDSEILLEDGSVATIEEIHGRRSARLLTLGDDLKLRTTAPSRFVDDGEKPVFRVTTRLGRRIETTLTHPFLTIRGWKPLAELEAGDRIAVPRRLPVFGERRMRECEIRILAYLIGDGGLTGGTARFTNTDGRLRDEFAESVGDFGGVTVRMERSGSGRAPTLAVAPDPMLRFTGRHAFAHRLDQALRARGRSRREVAAAVGVHPLSVRGWTRGSWAPSGSSFTRLCTALEVAPEALVPSGLATISRQTRNALVLWLEELGLMGKRAAEKTIPPAVFTLRRDLLALFLNRLFATDGWAAVLTQGGPQIGYCTTSEKLGRQIQHLLLRFGIVGSLRKRSVKYRETRRLAWQLDITDQASIRTFVDEIGIFGKEAAVSRVRRELDKRNHQTNTDLIPVEIWQRIAEIKGAESWAGVRRRMGLEPQNNNLHVGRRALSRKRLARLAAALDNEELRRLAESDVYWDRIVSIEPVGRKQVYDLTIPGTHNFVANDVCVHNTSFALSVAANAAIRYELPVAFFSLEMSTEQLVQRMISMEAMVSLKTLRTGRASGEEWKRVADACDRLRRAAIYIDDTGLLSPLEMRAKARRLKQQRDIGLVVVDYLQLMEGGARAENRQQEISEISRSLKALAKELNVPVMALSQLSRAPEQRSDQRPKLSDLRECVTGDTIVLLADGSRTPIRELVGTAPQVLAVDDRGRVVRARADRVWSAGIRRVFDVRLASGRRIRATARHRLLTGSGWQRVEDIGPGARLALARSLPEPGAPTEWPDARVALLGHLIGDGSYLLGQPMRYTTGSDANSDLVAQTSYGGESHFRFAPSRAVLGEYAEILDDDVLRDQASSDLFWDRVVEIRPDGEEEVFDLTVPGPASWLADGIVSHNSGAIEQDADLVLFLYRDPSKAAGEGAASSIVTEIIIGKNRNGPTGSVELVFQSDFMRFEPLDRWHQP